MSVPYRIKQIQNLSETEDYLKLTEILEKEMKKQLAIETMETIKTAKNDIIKSK